MLYKIVAIRLWLLEIAHEIADWIMWLASANGIRNGWPGLNIVISCG
jgi:hypothetical protein